MKIQRQFLPNSFVVSSWEACEPFFNQLLTFEITNIDALKRWLKCRSELESVLSEDLGRRYIRMTCDTTNEEYQTSYRYFVTEIDPKLQHYNNLLNEKLLQCPYTSELTSEAHRIMLKTIRYHHEIFSEKNIPLITQMQQMQVKYGAVTGALMVEIDGEFMTLQKASTLLMHTDAHTRQNAYNVINHKRISVKAELDELFSNLIKTRHQIAQNAGFQNYRDYMFKELCRFDYTPAQCFDFHDAVQHEVVPLLNEMSKKRKYMLKVDTLRPWDLAVDPQLRPPLKPFVDAQELINKSKRVFLNISPEVLEVLDILETHQHLDLESRKGKAPGGYNYPMYETGVPFIFMNAAGTLRDVVTMVHECGHAYHSILTSGLELINYKNLPSEVAELASMGMELISMPHWTAFFDDQESLHRAVSDHLAQIIETLPWVAAIDKFQHWIYENPNLTPDERTLAWNHIHNAFSSSEVDWSGLQNYKDNIWQKQLHLFEVPFYYIEYGIAQLGAVGVWKNYTNNPQKGFQMYTDALKLGYTQSIKSIYQAAGVEFDFSRSNIRNLMQFVKNAMEMYES